MKKHTVQGLAFVGICIVIGLVIFVVIHGNWSLKSDTNADAGNVASPEIGNITDASKPSDLSSYVGKYPSDVVNGTKLTDLPTVRAALISALGSEGKLSLFKRFAVEVPVATSAGRLWVHGCEANNCDNEYVILLARDGSSAEVCFQDGGVNGDDKAYWFANGGRAPKSDSCPVDDETARNQVTPNRDPDCFDKNGESLPTVSNPCMASATDARAKALSEEDGNEDASAGPQ